MSLPNRTTLQYELDDEFDLIVLSSDKYVHRNFDDVTKRASFTYRLPHPLDLARGWQLALIKVSIPITDNWRVQDSPHSGLGLSGKTNGILAHIRNTLNDTVVSQISLDRNKPHHNLFQLSQDVFTLFSLNRVLLPLHRAPSTDDIF